MMSSITQFSTAGRALLSSPRFCLSGYIYLISLHHESEYIVALIVVEDLTLELYQLDSLLFANLVVAGHDFFNALLDKGHPLDELLPMFLMIRVVNH